MQVELAFIPKTEYYGYTHKMNIYTQGGFSMKLWGGRFTKETNQLVHNFNASLSFDQKFYKQDIKGSIAHVTMLAKQQILTDE